MTLPEPAAYAFLDLVRDLARRSPWSERFSTEYIEQRIGRILIEGRDAGLARASTLLDELVTDVATYAIEHTAYVPVSGVLLAVEAFQLGQVVLRTMDEAVITGLKHRLTILYTGPDGRVNNPDLLASRQGEVERHLKGKVCAEFRAVAEPTRARERAEEATRQALELLTFGNAALHPFDRQADAVAGIEGEVLDLGPWVAVVSDASLVSTQRRPDTALPFQISQDSLQRLEAVGVPALAEVLALPPHRRGDLDQALLGAVHWFAASQTQAQLENRLLNLITCFETLFSRDRHSPPIRSTVAEGVAMIVTRGYEGRKQMKEFINAEYDARSGVSHGGATGISDAAVKELRYIATGLIVTLIRRRQELRSRQGLAEWLERQRLSGEPD